jgi:hypothetical protein
MDVKLAEDLGRIKQVSVVDDPGKCVSPSASSNSEIISRTLLTYFLAFQAIKGRLRMRGSQYPLMRNRKVKKAWTPASGMM